MDKTLCIEIGSEAEKHFVNDLMPICKDMVNRHRAVVSGYICNLYTITENDYYRVRNHLLSNK